MLRLRSNLESPNVYESMIEYEDRRIQAGHFLSLVSCYVPNFKPVDAVWIEYEAKDAVPGCDKKKRIDLSGYRTETEWRDEFETMTLPFRITIAMQKIVIHADRTELTLEFSPHAMWLAGFTGPRKFTMRQNAVVASTLTPPIGISMIKVLIENCVPNAISSEEFPVNTLCVLDSSNNFKFFNPHVIIDHEIVSGVELRIWFVDELNCPFTSAPVHLELFISPTPQHEKKQAFFRVKRDFTVTFPHDISQVAIADAFGGLPMLPIKHSTALAILHVRCSDESKNRDRDINLIQHASVRPLKGHIMTRTSWDLVFRALVEECTAYLTNTYPNVQIGFTLASAYHKTGMIMLVLSTSMNSNKKKTPWWTFTIELPLCLMPPHPKQPSRRRLLTTIQSNDDDRIPYANSTLYEHPQSVLYSEDDVVSIFCRSLNPKEALMQARNDNCVLAPVNRHFWYWTDVHPPVKSLDFTFERTTIYQNNVETAVPLDLYNLREKLGLDTGLIMRLIFK